MSWVAVRLTSSGWWGPGGGPGGLGDGQWEGVAVGCRDGPEERWKRREPGGGAVRPEEGLCGGMPRVLGASGPRVLACRCTMPASGQGGAGASGRGEGYRGGFRGRRLYRSAGVESGWSHQRTESKRVGRWRFSVDHAISGRSRRKGSWSSSPLYLSHSGPSYLRALNGAVGWCRMTNYTQK